MNYEETIAEAVNRVCAAWHGEQADDVTISIDQDEIFIHRNEGPSIFIVYSGTPGWIGEVMDSNRIAHSTGYFEGFERGLRSAIEALIDAAPKRHRR